MKEATKMPIGNNISMILGRRREKIREFARNTGISYTTANALYNAKTTAISFELLARLCAYFGVTPNDLFPYEPSAEDLKPKQPVSEEQNKP
jgi:putative transcriptional regulator